MSCGYTVAKYCTTCGNAVCETSEAFCSTNKDVDTHVQTVVDNPEFGAIGGWYTNVASGDPIIKKFTPRQQELLAIWIRAASAFGSKKNSGAHGVPLTGSNFVLASNMNSIIAGLQTLFGMPGPPPTVAKDGVVYASWFNTLMNAAKGAKFSFDACHLCNTSCDQSCQICNECDACEYAICSDCTYCPYSP